jgi:succinyl-diaminopimelate desuccinylase
MTELTPLALTQHLLSFDTINPPGQLRACAEVVADILQGARFRVDLYEAEDAHTNVVARLAGADTGAPICFSGHLDTVPLGRAAWSKQPFGEVAGERLYGRGSSDMKSGVAAMVIAAVRLAAIPGLQRGIKLVISADEEPGCLGAAYLAGLENALGEAGALVVAEPTANQVKTGHRGVLRFEIETSGITAHAAMPEEGDNAIYKAAGIVNALAGHDFQVAPHPQLGLPTLNVGTIAGGMNINSVPDQAVIGVDIRSLPSMQNETLFNDFVTLCGAETKLTKLLDLEGYFTDPQDPWVQEVTDIVATVTGVRADIGVVPYITDASVLTAAFGKPPTVILGPGETTMAHKVDEYCLIDRIAEAAEIYFQIGKRWCSQTA